MKTGPTPGNNATLESPAIPVNPARPVGVLPTEGGAGRRRPRLLLVDDEQLILTSLRRVLHRDNYDIMTALSGAEALQILEKEPIDLMISDQLMPVMTGIELLREVKRRKPRIVRIILSGYSDVNMILTAMNEGTIYKYVIKPWNDEELRIELKQALLQHTSAW